MDFIIGLIVIGAGIAILRYRYEIHHITGNIGWAEEYLSGTVNAIILVGMLCVMAGTAYPLGAFDEFFETEMIQAPVRNGTQL